MKDASSEFNLGLLACVLGSSAFAKRSLKILFYKHKMSLFYLLKGKISSFWINFLRIKWFKKTSCTELHTRKSTALQSDQKVNPSSTT